MPVFMYMFRSLMNFDIEKALYFAISLLESFYEQHHGSKRDIRLQYHHWSQCITALTAPVTEPVRGT